MDELACGDPGSPAKGIKKFVPPEIETISDPVMAKFFSTLQSHLIHSAEVIVGNHASISLINSHIRDVPEDHTTIWVAMGYIMKRLIPHGEVL